MLKYGLVFAIFFLFPHTLSAQPGIKGGLSVSALQLSGEDYTPFLGYEVAWVQHGLSNPVLGLQLGAFYTISISDEFIFQPELYFVRRGYQFDHTPLYDINYKLGIDFLELPLLIEYYIPLDWVFHPAITAGAYSSIKLNSNKRIRIPNKEITGTVSSVNTFDYGIILGIATEITAWEGELIFDLRINWGLANILSRPAGYISLYDNPGTVKTRAVALMTGYRFNMDL